MIAMAAGSVGKVVTLTARGSLLVKAPGPLRINAAGRKDTPRAENGPAVKVGSILVDGRKETAGKVMDIIGPVTAPYLVVSPPKGSKPNRFLGRDLFAR